MVRNCYNRCMTVSIVIQNYNGKALLVKNLPKVLAVAPQTEIIIVDDSSTDGSVEFLKKNFPKIKLIEKVQNHGFATSVNLGVRAAKGDIVFLLNSDAVPEKGFLTPILENFKHNEQLFAIGCLDKSIEGERIIERGRGIGRFERGFLAHGRGEINQSNTLWASGGSSAFRKHIWEQLGGMDEVFDPFYWEDIDLSYRALKSGFEVVFESKNVVTHSHEEGSIAKSFSSTEIKIISYRNQILFVWKNITDRNYYLNHFMWLPYHLLRSLFTGEGVFVRGLLEALRKLPKIMEARRKAQKLFTRTDAQVLSVFSK